MTMTEETRKSLRDVLLPVPADLHDSLRTIATIRHTSMRATMVWLLMRGVAWFDGLSKEQKESQ